MAGYKPSFKPGYNPVDMSGIGKSVSGSVNNASTGGTINKAMPPATGKASTGFGGTNAGSGGNANASVITPTQTITAEPMNPGVPAKAPAAPAAPAAPSGGLDPELDALYQDIFKEHQNSWGDTEKGINAQTAMNQRRSAEINANMGRSIGGGFMGMATQTQLSGQQSMLGAKQTWADRGRQLQLGYLDRQLTEKHRLEDLEAKTAAEGSGVPGGGAEGAGPPSVTSAKVNTGDIAKDPAARKEASDRYNSSSVYEKTAQAQEAWKTAPEELQRFFSGPHTNMDKVSRKAYEMFLKNGKWPTPKEYLYDIYNTSAPGSQESYDAKDQLEEYGWDETARADEHGNPI